MPLTKKILSAFLEELLQAVAVEFWQSHCVLWSPRLWRTAPRGKEEEVDDNDDNNDKEEEEDKDNKDKEEEAQQAPRLLLMQ